VDAQRLLGNENLQLIKVAQQVLFELSYKSRTPISAEIQNGHDNYLIEINAGFSLPDTAEREVALLRGQATEPSHKPPLDAIENRVSNGSAGIIAQW